MARAETVLDTSRTIAYSSMEFGVDPKLPIYSGGLGGLAGDHLKAASDENIPLVGVGLFYHHGYFRQGLRDDGWQQEKYPLINPKVAGLELIVGADGLPISVTVPIEDRQVQASAFLKRVGNVPLLLLTTRIRGNKSEDRMITAHLYGASETWDKQTRIRQEMILGIGGKKMLDKLGFRIKVYHLNEGHSAFLTIARVEELMEQGVDAEKAIEQVRANQLFTNHTLVPAGNDRFPADVLEREFALHLPLLGAGFTALRDRANHLDNEHVGTWSQAKLAMATSSRINAVSRIHSEAAAKNWGRDHVDYVTNGVHIDWIDDELKSLIDSDQARLIKHHTDPDYLKWRVEQIDPQEFKALRNRRRAALARFANNYVEHPYFDPDRLTIGYGRRAATYKRLDLPFRDPDRLLAIIENSDRPVQIIMAAKAHPQDDEGKKIIQRLVRLTKDPRFRTHALFIPDYDLAIARQMVTGSDVWLNVPKKPEEACGTSGMKSGMNGSRQWSVDDGWVHEVPDDLYFKIEDDQNPAIVAARVYHLLQEIIAPEFYSSNGQPLSDRWIGEAMGSMQHIIPKFSAARMVKEYNHKFYQPLIRTPVAA